MSDLTPAMPRETLDELRTEALFKGLSTEQSAAILTLMNSTVAKVSDRRVAAERAACARIARQEAEHTEARLKAIMGRGMPIARAPILEAVRTSIERIAKAIERGER